MKDFIAKAKAAHCDIVVFPELSIPGYFIGDIWDQPDYIDECVRFGDEIRDLSQGIAIIFGNVAKETDRVNLDGRTRKYNAMFIAYNGKWLSPARSPYPFYIKTLLPNYREFSDIRYFTSLIEVAQERHAFPEDFLSPVQIPFDDGRKFRIGPLICEDSWDENYPFKPMHYLGKMYDIDLFVNVSNSPFTLGKTQRRHRLFGQAIDKIHCPAIYVNCTGIQNNGKNIYTFDGASSTYQKRRQPPQRLHALYRRTAHRRLRRNDPGLYVPVEGPAGKVADRRYLRQPPLRPQALYGYHRRP